MKYFFDPKKNYFKTKNSFLLSNQLFKSLVYPPEEIKYAYRNMRLHIGKVLIVFVLRIFRNCNSELFIFETKWNLTKMKNTNMIQFTKTSTENKPRLSFLLLTRAFAILQQLNMYITILSSNYDVRHIFVYSICGEVLFETNPLISMQYMMRKSRKVY